MQHAGPKSASELLGHALCCQWAARLLFYPDRALLDALQSGRVHEQLSEAVARLRNPAPVASALTEWWDAWQVSRDDPLSLAEEYLHLFARQVLVSPYEGAYRSDLSAVPPADLAQLAALYAAFGLRVGQSAAERPDHISLELEFLAALLAKEAYALERGWVARARTATRARERFVGDHLQVWLPEFASRLRQHARLPLYPATAAFVQRLLENECLRRPYRREKRAGVASDSPPP